MFQLAIFLAKMKKSNMARQASPPPAHRRVMYIFDDKRIHV